jgi:hypothetical protein
MNLKKFGFIISLLVIVGLGMLVMLTTSSRIDYSKAGADSGFDSSWDSGGGYDGGSSSSWDYGGSYGSSGGGGSIIGGFFALIFIIIIFAVFIALVAASSSKSGDTTNLNQTFKPTLSYLNEEELEVLKSYGFTNETVLDAAYKAYVNIQYAWSNLDIDKARKLLSDELYNTYKSQLNVLRAKKQKNVMSDFDYVGGGITSIKEDGNTLTISLELSVTCKDYLINTENNMTVRGNAYKTNHYTYSLTFVVAKGKNAGVVNCPNCNAKLGEGTSVKCEYCGSTITRKASTLTLTRKEMIRQS